jgi:hypothetical protein
VSENSTSVFIQSLTDYEVLALAYSRMDVGVNQRLSELLDRNQAGSINAHERAELERLLLIAEYGTLLKARALFEAVQRGLLDRPPASAQF